MVNEIKYNPVNWAESTPIAGERLATNGYYTGEYKGSVIQDSANSGANVAHYVEEGIVHCGTLMQDAKDDEFPTVASE